MAIDRFHTIAGMPRAGSTLFCNLLNQNPLFKATNTSRLPTLLRRLSSTWSTAEEFKRDLQLAPEETLARMENTFKGAMVGWHSNNTKDVLLDKSRGWPDLWPVIRKIYPNSKMLVMVRDFKKIISNNFWLCRG